MSYKSCTVNKYIQVAGSTSSTSEQAVSSNASIKFGSGSNYNYSLRWKFTTPAFTGTPKFIYAYVNSIPSTTGPVSVTATLRNSDGIALATGSSTMAAGTDGYASVYYSFSASTNYILDFVTNHNGVFNAKIGGVHIDYKSGSTPTPTPDPDPEPTITYTDPYISGCSLTPASGYIANGDKFHANVSGISGYNNPIQGYSYKYSIGSSSLSVSSDTSSSSFDVTLAAGTQTGQLSFKIKPLGYYSNGSWSTITGPTVVARPSKPNVTASKQNLAYGGEYVTINFDQSGTYAYSIGDSTNKISIRDGASIFINQSTTYHFYSFDQVYSEPTDISFTLSNTLYCTYTINPVDISLGQQNSHMVVQKFKITPTSSTLGVTYKYNFKYGAASTSLTNISETFDTAPTEVLSLIDPGSYYILGVKAIINNKESDWYYDTTKIFRKARIPDIQELFNLTIYNKRDSSGAFVDFIIDGQSQYYFNDEAYFDWTSRISEINTSGFADIKKINLIYAYTPNSAFEEVIKTVLYNNKYKFNSNEKTNLNITNAVENQKIKIGLQVEDVLSNKNNYFIEKKSISGYGTYDFYRIKKPILPDGIYAISTGSTPISPASTTNIKFTMPMLMPSEQGGDFGAHWNIFAQIQELPNVLFNIFPTNLTVEELTPTDKRITFKYNDKTIILHVDWEGNTYYFQFENTDFGTLVTDQILAQAQLTNLNALYHLTITFQLVDDFGNNSNDSKKISTTVDYRYRPQFATNSKLIAGIDLTPNVNSKITNRFINTILSYDSAFPSMSNDLDDRYRLVNAGEKIVLTFPKATDYNTDEIIKYNIYVHRYSNAPTTISWMTENITWTKVAEKVDYHNETFTNKYAINSDWSDSYTSNQGYILHIMPNYNMMQYIVFKVEAEDSTGLTSEPLYSLNYLIGSRLDKPSFSIDNIVLDNYNLLIPIDKAFEPGVTYYKRENNEYIPLLTDRVPGTQYYYIGENQHLILNYSLLDLGDNSKKNLSENNFERFLKLAYNNYSVQNFEGKLTLTNVKLGYDINFTPGTYQNLPEYEYKCNYAVGRTYDNLYEQDLSYELNLPANYSGQKLYLSYDISINTGWSISNSTPTIRTDSYLNQILPVQATLPTISYRINSLGINNPNIDSQSVVYISQYGEHKNINLYGESIETTSGTNQIINNLIQIDLSTGKITALNENSRLIIDGGSWDD